MESRSHLSSSQKQNQIDIQEYLKYCQDSRQNSKETVAARNNQLRYVLAWIKDLPLSKGHTKSRLISNLSWKFEKG